MELWVAGTAGPVAELGGNEPGAGKPTRAPHLDVGDLGVAVVGAPADVAGLALEPRERLRDGRLAGLDDGALHERIAKRVRDRHRLRDRERQIEPGHPARMRPELLAVRGQRGARCEPGEDGAEILTGDLAIEAEPGGGVADPTADALALAGVVVVESGRDLGEVVGLGSNA